MEYLNNVSNPYSSVKEKKEISSRGHRTVGTGLNVNTSEHSLSNNMVTVPPVPVIISSPVIIEQPREVTNEDDMEEQ